MSDAITAPPPDPAPLATDSFGAARLPGIRLGRRRLWAVDDLRAWIAAGAPAADRWMAAKK